MHVKGASYTMCRLRASRAHYHSATVLLSMSRSCHVCYVSMTVYMSRERQTQCVRQERVELSVNRRLRYSACHICYGTISTILRACHVCYGSISTILWEHINYVKGVCYGSISTMLRVHSYVMGAYVMGAYVMGAYQLC